MFPVTALLPLLGNVATSLFASDNNVKKGLEIVQAVTGSAPADQSPAGLEKAILALPPEKLAEFKQKAETTALEMTKADTDRILNEGGRMDPDTLAGIPEKDRGKYALIKGLARPIIALTMTFLIAYPVLMLLFDTVIMFFNNILRVFFESIIFFFVEVGSPTQPIPQMQTLGNAFEDNTLYLNLYVESLTIAGSVVGGFMLLRQIDKHRATAGKPSMASAIGGLIGKLKG